MSGENRKSSAVSFMPVAGLVLALAAGAAAALAGFGSRLDLWHFRTGFTVLKFAAYCGLGCALLSIVIGAMAVRKRQYAGVLLSLLAFLIAILVFGMPYSWKVRAERYPRIHDISTDLDNPPKFVAIIPLRFGPVEYPGATVAALQLKAYPDLKTLVLPVAKDQAFQSALDAAHEMDWQIVAVVPAEGRIEATDTTRWFGFKDDIVVRIFPAGQRSLIDVRSVSRVGISDLGTNAKRIRTFLAKLSHQRK
jgi:hypothetical protein